MFDYAVDIPSPALQGMLANSELSYLEMTRLHHAPRRVIAFSVDQSTPRTPDPLPPNRPAGPNAVRLMDLSPATCRFPVGDAVDHLQLFCGEPAPSGSAYCPACRAIAFRPRKPNKISVPND